MSRKEASTGLGKITAAATQQSVSSRSQSDSLPRSSTLSPTDSAKPSVLNSPRMHRLAKACVDRLNNLAGSVLEKQIGQGRLTAKFVAQTRTLGGKKTDAFRLLSMQPECVLQPSMLRNYCAVAEMYDAAVRTDPAIKSLTLTHFVAVLPSHMAKEEKVRILSEAAKQNLSTSQTKDLIRDYLGNHPRPKVRQHDRAAKVGRFAKDLLSWLQEMHQTGASPTAGEITEIQSLGDVTRALLALTTPAAV